MRSLAPPGAVACAFEHPHYKATLRLRPDGPAAVEIWIAGSRVLIPQEPQGGVWVDVKRPQIRLGAWMRADELVLFASRPLVFGGWLSVRGYIPLRWRAYKSASLWIAAPRPASIRSLEQTERPTACDEVSLSPSFFDPMAPFALQQASRGLLSSAWSIPLRAEVDGQEVAYLDVRAPLGVAFYERTARHARIGFHVDEGAVVAWVDMGALRPPPPSHGLHGSHSTKAPITHSDIARVEPMGELLKCSADLALGLEVGDDRALVGSAVAGTTIKVVRREGAIAHVELPDASTWVRLERGARWIVPLDQLTISDAGMTGCQVIRNDHLP